MQLIQNKGKNKRYFMCTAQQYSYLKLLQLSNLEKQHESVPDRSDSDQLKTVTCTLANSSE